MPLLGSSKPFSASVILACLALLPFGAAAQEAVRTNHIPSGDYSEGVVGDLWTFRCPRNGTVSIAIDTKNDNGDGTSNLNLRFEIVDGKGNFLAVADDEMACTYDSVCGYDCPQVVGLACGVGALHTLAIYSVPSNPSNSLTGQVCSGGGGYQLTMSAANRRGVPLKEKKFKLGGGARRRVPRWAGGIGKKGPALDDEGVPSFFFP